MTTKKIPQKKEGILRAEIDGKIAGLPDACERAERELADIHERLGNVLASGFVFGAEVDEKITAAATYSTKLLNQISELRKIADSLRRFQPEKRADLSLF